MKSISAVSVVDLALMGAGFMYLKKEIDSLKTQSPINFPTPLLTASNSKKDSLETKVIELENNQNALIYRLNCYDKLFEGILNKIKVLDSSSNVSNVSSEERRKTSLLRRDRSSVLARKEPFVSIEENSQVLDDESVNINSEDDDENFAHLK